MSAPCFHCGRRRGTHGLFEQRDGTFLLLTPDCPCRAALPTAGEEMHAAFRELERSVPQPAATAGVLAELRLELERARQLGPAAAAELEDLRRQNAQLKAALEQARRKEREACRDAVRAHAMHCNHCCGAVERSLEDAP